MKSEAYLKTPNGVKYMQQLCKHFGHKIEVEVSDTEATCAMPLGPARMKADAHGLWVEVTAETAELLERARSVIDSHLVRFAFRESFEAMPWDAGSVA